MMIKIWDDEAWEDYISWQYIDKKILKRINLLIKDIERNGCLTGIGKPEELKYDLSGWCSKRIDKTNRLVYRVVDNKLEIAQCKNHY